MFTYKIDEQISLKLIDLHDADEVFALTDENRDYLKQWLPWLDTTTRVEDTRGFIQSSIKGYAANKSLTTVILYKEKIVGIAGYNELDWSNRVAKIGYWLASSYQGLGIMTRVAHALTSYAIEKLHVNRVDIRAAVDNKKSRAIPERLGFTYEGCLRQAEWLYDHYVDHAVYSMLREEWQKRP